MNKHGAWKRLHGKQRIASRHCNGYGKEKEQTVERRKWRGCVISGVIWDASRPRLFPEWSKIVAKATIFEQPRFGYDMDALRVCDTQTCFEPLFFSAWWFIQMAATNRRLRQQQENGEQTK